MSICRLSNLAAICEKTVMNFKNPKHGFCAEGSHLVDLLAVCEKSTWFESIFHFSEYENARFWDGRFSIWKIHSQTH